MPPLRVGIVGVGNCASALVQGVHYYSTQPSSGLVRTQIGPWTPADIEFAVAYDIDARKVGWPISKAIFAKPNCCIPLSPGVRTDTSARFDGPVLQGPQLDGVAWNMRTRDPEDSERFLPMSYPKNEADKAAWIAAEVPPDVVHFAEDLKTYGVDVLVNYLPVGSKQATEFWATVCLLARVPMVNCIPVFIASDPVWAARFRDAKVAIIGDDMKSQFGASVLSQALQELADSRGHKVHAHIQQNSGGNTDFLNMTNQERLADKKVSKENVLRDHGTAPDFVHAGPSDYVRHYGDTKVAHFRLELTGFCGSPVKLDAKLEVQDSPNSAGVVIDAVRYVANAQRLGRFGPVNGASAFTQKSPPVSMSMREAIEACDELAHAS